MLPVNFGLSGYAGLMLYITAVAALILTIFYRPIIGIYYLIPLLPLQTIRYRLNGFPLGASIIGVMLVAVAVGLMKQGRPILPRTRWTVLFCVFGIYTFVSLWLGSFYLGSNLPFPGEPRFGVWQEYIMMPWMLLMVASISPEKKHIRLMIILMCLSTLAVDRSYWTEVSDRDYSTYTESLRNDAAGGPLGYAGSNGLGAYEAQFITLLLALAAFEPRLVIRLGYIGVAIFSTCCLAYSLSRGGYAALLAGCLFIGIVKQRKLLLLLILLGLTCSDQLPPAVQHRILMTYDKQENSLDASAAVRLTLWEDAMQLFNSSPVIGTGFNTYAYMHRVRGGLGAYEDTHNYFLKVAVETGIVGLALFLALVWITFRAGFGLYRQSEDPFFASLGLGLAGWVVCAMVANCFGDRWTYAQITGYMWIIGGFVARGLEALDGDEADSEEPGTEESAPERPEACLNETA
jgi:O-antigen ligase